MTQVGAGPIRLAAAALRVAAHHADHVFGAVDGLVQCLADRVVVQGRGQVCVQPAGSQLGTGPGEDAGVGGVGVPALQAPVQLLGGVERRTVRIERQIGQPGEHQGAGAREL